MTQGTNGSYARFLACFFVHINWHIFVFPPGQINFLRHETLTKTKTQPFFVLSATRALVAVVPKKDPLNTREKEKKKKNNHPTNKNKRNKTNRVNNHLAHATRDEASTPF